MEKQLKDKSASILEKDREIERLLRERATGVSSVCTCYLCVVFCFWNLE